MISCPSLLLPHFGEGDDEALSEEERELRAAEALGRCHDWYTGVKAALRQTEW